MSTKLKFHQLRTTGTSANVFFCGKRTYCTLSRNIPVGTNVLKAVQLHYDIFTTKAFDITELKLAITTLSHAPVN